ncbi:hypothetical protein GCM10011369_28380 [Neiella marina]|uniref:Uncharacterized protein n=1 Tax=Neiella marina TaxID=508461 RepID=A0A8J2XQE8_9GAMM|nr:hypothetical protein [Neiella marina]GGA84673.1 hypothetical protein GCM10011369_28380 [Neiella marina]
MQSLLLTTNIKFKNRGVVNISATAVFVARQASNNDRRASACACSDVQIRKSGEGSQDDFNDERQE